METVLRATRGRLRALPLAVFLLLVVAFVWGLQPRDDSMPSALVGRVVPDAPLPVLGSDRQVSLSQWRGEVVVLNVWASWCAPCKAEHPMLMQLGQDRRFRLVGLLNRDTAVAGQQVLDRDGNPFAAVLHDPQGRYGIELGVYGTPETFVLDRDGTVRWRHAGPLDAQIIRERLEPMLAQLL
jgi:cytochrome c biogenesis protein CcmG, thiol:disulfide interchange protein DsbE